MGGGRASTPPTRLSEQGREAHPATVREASTGLPGFGEVVAGRWRIDQLVGSGGMSHVFAAFDTRQGEDVAFKVLAPELAADPDSIERFGREVRALATLTTPHVVRIRDVGRLGNGLPFMTMELLVGRDLGRVLAERGPLPVLEACEYVAQACEAVDEAHRAGLVHRDLKPGNLFLTHVGGRPILRVLDFGIVRAPGVGPAKLPTITRAGALVGTVSYMAPEQIRSSHRVDARADIWALGACLYKLLTNQPPFAAANETTMLEAIDGAPPTPIGDHRADVPPVVAGIVFRCLRKNPEERYPTAAALRAALVEARGAVVAAPATSPGTEAMAPLAPTGSRRPASFVVPSGPPPTFGPGPSARSSDPIFQATQPLSDVHAATAPLTAAQLPPAFRPGAGTGPVTASRSGPAPRRLWPLVLGGLVAVALLFGLGAGLMLYFLR